MKICIAASPNNFDKNNSNMEVKVIITPFEIMAVYFADFWYKYFGSTSSM